MKVTQDHISQNTKMGANLVADGATFRVWAPRAQSVYVNGQFGTMALWSEDDPDLLLKKDVRGYWSGFLQGVQEGDQYLFYVVGDPTRKNFKRDPYARELTTPDTHPGTSQYPSCNCLVRDPNNYRWRVNDFRPPAFNDLIIYELHIGTFFAVDQSNHDRRATRGGQYLDVLDRLEHLRDLGGHGDRVAPDSRIREPDQPRVRWDRFVLARNGLWGNQCRRAGPLSDQGQQTAPQSRRTRTCARRGADVHRSAKSID